MLCDWCLRVAEREQVLIQTSLLALPLVRSLHRALLERGAWPVLRLAPSQLAIEAPANTRALASVDPAQIARVTRASEPVRQARMQRRWCGTIWPTPALAQQAGMGDAEYARFLARALFVDRPDPVAAWRELSEGQERVIQRLAHASEIRIEAEGTDLLLRVDGRKWINSDGRRNMPSGEVFTGPLENSANGTILFTLPSSPRGVEVARVELRFRDGEVVRARAERGDDYLQQALLTDVGARFLGELGIGTNAGIDRPTGSILLDEKIAGTVHLALGRSYPETGGRNVSALHWDLICDLRGGGHLHADGEPIVEDGALVE